MSGWLARLLALPGLEVIANNPRQDFDQPGGQDGLLLTLTIQQVRSYYRPTTPKAAKMHENGPLSWIRAAVAKWQGKGLQNLNGGSNPSPRLQILWLLESNFRLKLGLNKPHAATRN